MDHVFPDDDAGIEDLKIHVASIYPYIMTVKRLPTCLVLLSQKVAAVVEMNHVSGEIHFSACEGLRWVCQDQVTRRRGLRRMSRV
jgi:hypothetical protein